MMIEELYDALIEAGASEAKARAASRAIADFDRRFTAIDASISAFRGETERRLTEFRAEVDKKFTEFRADVDKKFAEFRAEVDKKFAVVEGTLKLHNWMMGTTIALLIAIFFKVFSR